MSGPVRLRSLIPRPGRRRRRVWVGAGKAHIEVRGADGPAHGPLASELAVALQRIDSVHWAELHGPTGRLVVAFEEGAGPVRELIAVVEEVEAATGVCQELFPEGRPDHPGDWEPVAAQLVALAADSAALGLAIAGRAARLARLPMEVASLVPLVQAQPRLQHLLEARLGSQATHLTLAVGNAVVQAMAQGPLGLVVDAGVRATLATEAQARRRAWEATEARLCPGFADAPCPPPEVVSRPVPLPPGPVEQFVERAGIASLGAFGASLLATRDVRRSAAVFFAGTPKAATLGREAFAAHLGRLLSARGVVAFDAGVLRRLDRIDCVVLDRSVLGSPAVEIDRVVLVAASDQIDAERMVAGLFDPERPDRVRRRGEWRLGPLDRLRVKETAGLRRARLELGESGSVLGLARGGRLVAIARIAERLDPVATSLIAAARAGGHMVVGADVGRDLADRLGVDLFVDGGDRLAASVRMLQDDGCGVLLVTVEGDDALRAADCGLAVSGPGRRTAWGADVVCPTLAGARFVVEVFARGTPAQKVRIVTAYQRQGRAVAMTGDGANDAPAIRLADIGVALGEHATAAARRSADVVVPYGRIETLIEAIVEGRAMWASVRDALALLLGGNLGEVAFTVVGAVVSGKPPLSPRQLLLVNLLTDGLPALAIASRPPANRSPDQLLREGPEASLGRPLERAILDRAAVTALGATGAWLLGAPLPPRQRSTAALVSLVGTQLAQTALSGTHDRRVVLTSVGSAAALALLVQTPGVSQFFGCAPLGPVGWSVAVGSAVAATAVGVAAPNALRALVRIDASEHGGRQLEAVG